MLLRMHAAQAANVAWVDYVRARWRAFALVATQALRNAATRRELAEMDDRMLADIGLSRSEALREVNHLPWVAEPRHGRRPQQIDTVTFRNRVRQMWLRHRARQRIAQLDGITLKDIGVSFAEAEAEANKPFWRI